MKKVIFIAALVAAAAPSFSADLWDQQVGLNLGTQDACPDQIYTNGPTDSSYMLSNVTVGSAGWSITTISEFFVLPYTSKAVPSDASIEILAGGSAIPSADPTTYTTASLTSTGYGVNGVGNPVYLLTANVDITLKAGNYWIGLTPSGSSTDIGQSYSYYSATNVAGAAYQDVWINPGAGQGFGSGYLELQNLAELPSPLYGSIDIQGGTAAPEPVSLGLLGFASLALLRKKRRR